MEETKATSVPAQQSQDRDTRRGLRTLGLVLGAILILALVGAAGYGLATHPSLTAVLRDLFIIVLALVTIVIGLFLAILIFQLQSLISLLRDEIKPILESATQTASTVRGTTAFVSEAIVTPVISAASYITAVRHTLGLLAGSRSRTSKQQSQQTVPPRD